MTDEPANICSATAQHPTLDMIGCELPADHDGPHKFDPQDGEGTIEWDDSADDERPRAAFDVEQFVKNLPAGVCLCPLCLGMGAVVEEPPFDPTTHMCATCLGRGKVRTGSLKSDQAERDCVPCQGRGWMPNESGAPDASPARSVDVDVQLAARDHMGRTPDDPEFDWTRVVHAAAVAEPEPEPVA